MTLAAVRRRSTLSANSGPSLLSGGSSEGTVGPIVASGGTLRSRSRSRSRRAHDHDHDHEHEHEHDHEHDHDRGVPRPTGLGLLAPAHHDPGVALEHRWGQRAVGDLRGGVVLADLGHLEADLLTGGVGDEFVGLRTHVESCRWSRRRPCRPSLRTAPAFRSCRRRSWRRRRSCPSCDTCSSSRRTRGRACRRCLWPPSCPSCWPCLPCSPCFRAGRGPCRGWRRWSPRRLSSTCARVRSTVACAFLAVTLST